MVTAEFGRRAALRHRNTISQLDAGDINDTIRSNNLMGDLRVSLPAERVDRHFLSSPKEPSYSYISLRDLLDPASPIGTSLAGHRRSATCNRTVDDIPIRNRLVQHAAWAYLQPMAASLEPASSNFIRPPWSKFSTMSSPRSPSRSCLSSFKTRIFSPISRALSGILSLLGFREDKQQQCASTS